MFFIFILILSIVMFCLLYKNAAHHTDASPQKTKLKYVATAICIIDVLLAEANAFIWKDSGEFSEGYIVLGISAAIVFILSILINKFHSRTLIFAMKAVAIAAVLEVTLFNIPTYRLWSGDYPEAHYTAAEAVVEQGGYYDEEEGVIRTNEDEEVVVLLEGINIPVGTVYTKAIFSDKVKGGNYIIDLKDETSMADYRYNIIEDHFVRDRPNSGFLHIEASGKVSDIRIKASSIGSYSMALSSFSFNVPIPMEVSWLRFWFIVAVSCFIYALFHEKNFRKPVSESKRSYTVIALTVTCAVCLIGQSLWSAKTDNKEKLWKLETGNQVTQELVDAFEKGSVSLLDEPDEEALEFQNIYDKSVRESEGLGYSWDHVYYEGKYYSYYGVAPVILLFLPYHLLTGYYFDTGTAILLFSLIGFLGLTALFSRFVSKFFPSLSLGDTVVCLILLQAASGLWYSLGRMDFYEIATASGFAFLTWGVYFLLSANIIGKGQISLPKTAVSSLLIAVSVLCRPTLALYCVCAAVFFLLAIRRSCGSDKSQGSDNKTKKQDIFTKRSIAYLLCAILPMAVLGGCQMWYNYARFGSPFEFGIKYSLTINNFTATEFHWQISLITLFNYLFNTPVFTPVYPFVRTEPQHMGIGSFFYFDNWMTYSTTGIFWTVLPMFSYFLSKKALRRLPDRKTKLAASAYIGIPCVVIPLIIIALIWESGYATRYIADFAWEMIIGAYAILFFLYTRTSNETIKKLIRLSLCFSMLWAVIISGLHVYGQAFRFYDYHYEWPEKAYDLERLLQFWK